MKIRPLHDRILAQRLAEQTKTSGGLFIPDNAKEKPLEALVISVGTGMRNASRCAHCWARLEPLAPIVSDVPRSNA